MDRVLQTAYENKVEKLAEQVETLVEIMYSCNPSQTYITELLAEIHKTSVDEHSTEELAVAERQESILVPSLDEIHF